MMFVEGRNPMRKNSFRRSSVMVEGTQLQMVGVFDGMMCKGLEKEKQHAVSIYGKRLKL